MSREREVGNSNEGEPMPRATHELADYAAHHLAELHMLISEAPLHLRPDLRSIGETFERVTLYLDAIYDEGPECAMRIIARAQLYEERLKAQHTVQPEFTIPILMLALFHEHAAKRGYGPGHARSRGVGFQHNNDL